MIAVNPRFEEMKMTDTDEPLLYEALSPRLKQEEAVGGFLRQQGKGELHL
jgi:hypothetical protein